jgi:hypothetical protein
MNLSGAVGDGVRSLGLRCLAVAIPDPSLYWIGHSQCNEELKS